MVTLYVVATPIGNLKDITFRAVEVLRDADLILAEDTRVTRKLLNHYGVKTPVRRYDEHVGPQIYDDLAVFLQGGRSAALVSDAGTPLVSDPGSRLIEFLRTRIDDLRIVPIPGPAALIAALSASGVNADQFTFLGYPPHKKGRQTFFQSLKEVHVKPLVFYESPHRLQKSFAAIEENFGPEKEIIVAKELTKIYEEVWRGVVSEAKERFRGDKGKGEFAIILP